jgi:hypothetical protein
MNLAILALAFSSITPSLSPNQIDRPGGAGSGFSWNIGGGDFTFRSLYIAANSDQDLFGDRNTGSIELEIRAPL